MIVVTSEPARKLVRAVMRGLLTLDEVARFSDEEQVAVARMGLKSGEFVLIIQTSGHQVQTLDVMEAFRSLMLTSPLKARKIATVRDGVLNRMQSRRVSQVRANAEVFGTVEEAEAWLMEP